MKALKILAIALAVLVATAALCVFLFFQHFTGEDGEANTLAALDRVWEASVEPELKAQVNANEEQVAVALALYRDAQATYKQSHGRYAERLADLDLPDEMIRAGFESTTNEGYEGYRFGTVPLDGALENSWVHRYTVCAVPASYRVTGIHTYAMDSDGVTLRRDNWGIPPENTVDFLDGSWESIATESPVN